MKTNCTITLDSNELTDLIRVHLIKSGHRAKEALVKFNTDDGALIGDPVGVTVTYDQDGRVRKPRKAHEAVEHVLVVGDEKAPPVKSLITKARKPKLTDGEVPRKRGRPRKVAA
jgi:hypothetical protein